MKDNIEELKKKVGDLEKRVLKLESKDSPLNDDELLGSVIESLKDLRDITTSFVQRRFSVGYSRATKLLDILEEKGLIAKANGAKSRKVLSKK